MRKSEREREEFELKKYMQVGGLNWGWYFNVCAYYSFFNLHVSKL